MRSMLPPILWPQPADKILKTGNPNEIRLNCSNCQDTKYHLYVNKQKKVFHCFRCQASGRVIQTEQPSLSEFAEKVDAFLKSGQKPEVPMEYELRLPDEYQALHCAPRTRLGSFALDYLHNRGLTNDEIHQYDLGYCSKGFYEGRIIIPITLDGKLKYFVGRSYTGREPKYLNPLVEKKSIVFFAGEKNPELLVLCEGVFDAIRVGRVLPTAALLGKELHQEQKERLFKRTKRILLMLDPDATLFTAKYYLELCRDIPCVPLFLEQQDPGAMKEDVIIAALRKFLNWAYKDGNEKALDFLKTVNTIVEARN